jgi:hypothetical protein
MRKLLTTCALLSTLSGLGLAETWNGTLLDANCSARHHATKSCDAKPSTAAFALDVNGKTYRLDTKSNDDARSVMKARADKATNPAATKAVPVTATIKGTLRSSGKIHAKTIEVQ